MTDPNLMCSKHRVGEHGEIHKHRHNFEKQHNISGRIYPEIQIEPESMKKRHDQLAAFMDHKSEFSQPDLSYLPDDQRYAKVNVMESYRELCRRCPECRAKIEKIMGVLI